MNITNRVIRTVEKRAARRERKVKVRGFFDGLGQKLEALQLEQAERVRQEVERTANKFFDEAMPLERGPLTSATPEEIAALEAALAELRRGSG